MESLGQKKYVSLRFNNSDSFHVSSISIHDAKPCNFNSEGYDYSCFAEKETEAYRSNFICSSCTIRRCSSLHVGNHGTWLESL